MKKFLILILIVMSISSISFGVIYHFNGTAGNPTLDDVGNYLLDNGSPATVLPGSSDTLLFGAGTSLPDMDFWATLGAGKSMTFQEMQVGYTGDGYLSVNGGTLNEGGAFWGFIVGGGIDSNSVLEVTDGGTINVRTLRIGYDGQGTLTVDGGSVYENGWEMSLGQWDTSSGTVNLYDGLIDVQHFVNVGLWGQGRINIAGGTFKIGQWWDLELPDKDVGVGGGVRSGHVQLDGGMLDISGLAMLDKGSIDLTGGLLSINTYTDRTYGGANFNDLYDTYTAYVENGWITGGGSDEPNAVNVENLGNYYILMTSNNNVRTLLPSDKSVVSATPLLTWSAPTGLSDATYNVYIHTTDDFSSVSPVATGVSTNYYTASGLSNDTQYFWKVDVVANDGTVYAGGLPIRFTTVQSDKITNPRPADTQVDVLAGSILKWDAISGATYDVYMGKSAGGLTLMADDITTNSFDPTGTANEITFGEFFWRVDVDGVQGDLMSFRCLPPGTTEAGAVWTGAEDRSLANPANFVNGAGDMVGLDTKTIVLIGYDFPNAPSHVRDWIVVRKGDHVKAASIYLAHTGFAYLKVDGGILEPTNWGLQMSTASKANSYLEVCNGGVVQKRHIWMSIGDNSESTITVKDGGIINLLGWWKIALTGTYANSKGTINIEEGGTVMANNIETGSGTAKINIAGGRLVVARDVSEGIDSFDEVQALIDSGIIVADDGNPNAVLEVNAYGINGIEVTSYIPSSRVIASDITGDNFVGIEDLAAMASVWTENTAYADLNGNGKVDFEDFAILANDWGADGSVYYVDSAAPAGGDGTFNSPLNNLDVLNTITFEAGDSILLKSGSVFNDQQLRVHGSGTVAEPIIVTSYGQGAKPVINTNGAYTAAIQVVSVDNWDISGLEVTNMIPDSLLGGHDPICGVQIQSINKGTMSNIKVSDMYLSNIKSGARGGGIRAFCKDNNGTNLSKFDGLLIEDNTLENMGYIAIATLSEYDRSTTFNPSTNVVIKNNVMNNITAAGIEIHGLDGALVTGNYLNGAGTDITWFMVGMWAWACDNTTFEYNTVIGVDTTLDGQAFDSDGGCRNVVFQYNYSKNNKGGFMLVTQGDAAPTDPWANIGTIVRYNISEDDQGNLFETAGHITGLLVYNNTFKSNGISPYYCWNIELDSATFSNNIFYNTGASTSFEESNSAGSSNVTFNNNAYYGYSGLPTDGSTINADPMFAAGLDEEAFKLQSSSPCIGVGVTIPSNGGVDYWGSALGSTIDVGAHNYSSGN